MAVRARFGRLPRSSPSLTSTIVQLAQQYQNTRDRNIETVWKEGGTFEGKKVTDSMFLNHWKARLKEVSPDDPMWDYYSNLIYSYDFMIEESKMGLKYAEEKVSEKDMAQFYRKWAAKLPTDSQAYRDLMTQAAKFKAAAASRGYGRRASAQQDAYNKAQQDTYDRMEQPYETAKWLITNYAVGKDILDRKDLDDKDGGWSKLTMSPGETDALNLTALLADMMEDKEWRDAATAFIKANGDSNFGGVFSEETLVSMGNTARNGALQRARRATKNGDTSGAKAARKTAESYATSSMVIRAVLGDPNKKGDGFIEQNDAFRNEMDAIMDPNSPFSPTEQANAVQEYGNWLKGEGTKNLLRSFPPGTFDPLHPGYNEYANGLMGRVNGTLSMLEGNPVGLTLKDDVLGFDVESPGESSDAVRMGAMTNALWRGMEAVASGTSIVVPANAEGKVDPKGKGWAIVDRTDAELEGLELVPIAHAATMIKVPGANGAVTTYGGGAGEVRHLIASPVKGKVYAGADPRTGVGVNEMKPSKSEDEVIGSRVEVPGPGGTTIVVWGVYVGGGQMVYTHTDPFKQTGRGGSGRYDDKGNYVLPYIYDGPIPAEGELPLYSPASLSQGQALEYEVDGKNSKTGQPWNPQTDRATAFLSPNETAYRSSSKAMEYASLIGDDAVTAAERAWYSDTAHWTPDMHKNYAKGGFEYAVDTQAGKLATSIQSARYWGFSPEDQQPTRKTLAGVETKSVRQMMQDKADAELAARTGKSLAQVKAENAAGPVSSKDAKDRRDLSVTLAKWDRERTKPEDAQSSKNIQRAAMGLEPLGSTAGPSDFRTKGWSVGTLLNQPGMSLVQANDLVYQITGGAHGIAGPKQIITEPTAGVTGGPTITGGPKITGGPTVSRSKGYVNPYLTPTGSVPKTTPTPRPKPKEEPETEVNDATGFTVPKSKTLRKTTQTTYRRPGGGFAS